MKKPVTNDINAISIVSRNPISIIIVFIPLQGVVRASIPDYRLRLLM